MADESDFASRTEDPTPRRREEAAEKGQFAFSTELNTGIGLLVGVGGVALLAHTLGGGMLDQTRVGLTTMPSHEMPIDVVQNLLGNLFSRGLVIMGLFLGVTFAATLAVNFGQVGLRLNTDKLTLDWQRVSPLQLGRLLSWNKLMRGLFLMAKITAMAIVAWWILRKRGGEIAHLGDAGLGAAIANSWSLILRLALAMAATLVVIGVADYGYQRWHFERSLRMTKQEIKDEMKREEGDPQIKARIRKMQRDTAQRKMFTQVSKATVVVTNPTHLAIALQYDSATMTAPKVVAKGAGHIAKRIIELARSHGVPVIERKPLAQGLFKAVKVDREIPLGFYLVVAELLAHVYQLKGGAPTQTRASA